MNLAIIALVLICAGLFVGARLAVEAWQHRRRVNNLRHACDVIVTPESPWPLINYRP